MSAIQADRLHWGFYNNQQSTFHSTPLTKQSVGCRQYVVRTAKNIPRLHVSQKLNMGELSSSYLLKRMWLRKGGWIHGAFYFIEIGSCVCVSDYACAFFHLNPTTDAMRYLPSFGKVCPIWHKSSCKLLFPSSVPSGRVQRHPKHPLQARHNSLWPNKSLCN